MCFPFLHFGRKKKEFLKSFQLQYLRDGGKNQQICIFSSKEFLAFWATYSEKILHLLFFFFFAKMVKVLTMVHI
jgi:hypothetical protein